MLNSLNDWLSYQEYGFEDIQIGGKINGIDQQEASIGSWSCESGIIGVIPQKRDKKRSADVKLPKPRIG